MNIYSVFKHLAFKIDPEFIHDLTINSAKALPLISELFTPLRFDKKYQITDGPLTWGFPVGVAAGFDKNGNAINFFEQLGFGALEAGTVTKIPQKGNNKPRVFRHAKINSIQNAMGFPNAGSEKILKNIKDTELNNICLGVNIGKNKDTSEADTPAEYAYLYKMFAPFCDYLVVNISSPNTPGLRSFQKEELLAPILKAINSERKLFDRPVFIKIAPDLEDADLKMICELSKKFNFSGIIATNTTIQHKFGAGGLSGDYIKPYSQQLRKKACEFLREDPSQTIIGVGGIDSYQEIKDFWRMGGGLTQIYTSFIFKGPQLLKDIALDIEKDIQNYQVETVQQLFEAIKEKG
jgi:dihydroorotate dehydrogenase